MQQQTVPPNSTMTTASRVSAAPGVSAASSVTPASSSVTFVAPLTTAELGRLIGMSATFIREEIHGGFLRAVTVGHGRKRVFRILPDEARRYMEQLGVIGATTKPQ